MLVFYQLNDYIISHLNISTEALSLSQALEPTQATTTISGKELALHRRIRSDEAPTVEKNDENLIGKFISKISLTFIA